MASVLLLVGGFQALQNVITTLGFPFSLLLIFMVFAMYQALRGERQGLSPGDLSARQAGGARDTISSGSVGRGKGRSRS